MVIALRLLMGILSFFAVGFGVALSFGLPLGLAAMGACWLLMPNLD